MVSNNERPKRISKGKQKITIKRIESKAARQVTFSKRRKGLFKKCLELCSMSGSQFAAITFSGAGRMFSSGWPSVEAVMNRFVHDSRMWLEYPYLITEDDCCPSSTNVNDNWWDVSVDDLGLKELEEFKAALEGLRNDVISRAKKISPVDLGCTDEAEIIDLECTKASDGTEHSDLGCTDAKSSVQL